MERHQAWCVEGKERGPKGRVAGAWAVREGDVEAEDKDRESYRALASLVCGGKGRWERGSKGWMTGAWAVREGRGEAEAGAEGVKECLGRVS